MDSMGAKCECFLPRVCVGACVCPCMCVDASTYVHVRFGVFLCGTVCFTPSIGGDSCAVHITFVLIPG